MTTLRHQYCAALSRCGRHLKAWYAHQPDGRLLTPSEAECASCFAAHVIYQQRLRRIVARRVYG